MAAVAWANAACDLCQTFFTMPDDNRYTEDDKNAKKTGEFKVPPRTWMVWIAIVAGIILLVMFHNRVESQPNSLSSSVFLQKLDSNLIAQASVTYNPQSEGVSEINGTYYKTDSKGSRILTEAPAPFRTTMFLTDELKSKLNHLDTFQLH